MDHPRPAEGRRGLVTRLAGRGGREVGRRLAQRRRTVMTGRATRHDPGVTKRGPRKRRRGLVTCLARGGGRDVVRRLAHDPRISAAMTGRAADHYPRVIHRGARPEGRRRLVARLARLGRRDMRRDLAFRLGPVMAGGAGSRHHARVVVARGDKQPIRRAHSVAGIARKSCRYVPSRLPTGLNPIMAGHAGACPDPRMFEGCASPANRPMAAVAGHGRRNMSSWLAYRGSLVMASGAGSRDHAVVRKKRGFPACGPVATVTVHRGGQMVRRLKGGHDSTAG